MTLKMNGGEFLGDNPDLSEQHFDDLYDSVYDGSKGFRFKRFSGIEILSPYEFIPKYNQNKRIS